MELFHIIDDSHAIIRLAKGVMKQVKLYRRGERLYVPHSGGFVEVRSQQVNKEFGTAHPSIMLVDYECPQSSVVNRRLVWRNK